MESRIIYSSLTKNKAFIKNEIGESFDTKYRSLKVSAFNYSDAFIVYVSGLVDTRIIDETILEPLMQCTEELQYKKDGNEIYATTVLKESGIFTVAVKETMNWLEICDSIMEGDTVLFIDECPTALILTTKKYEGRAVDEPSTESEIKGPRDGFVENIQINAALIRRRIKDHGLRFDSMKLGTRTKTLVSIVYIQSLVDERLLSEVRNRLERIKVDSILASEYIEEFIQDSAFSPFPQLNSTERPDKVSAALLEGRVAIMVDNVPFVITLPAVFWEFFMSSGDYYVNVYLASFIRWIRLIAMFISISAASLYVLLTSYHQEMLPTALALKIAAGRVGVPFPAVLEAGVMEIALEIMKEAGLRMPKPLGQTVSIVGTIVIGQAAVAAGIVGPLLVIVVAIEAIATFAIPSYIMSNALRLVKFPILLATAFFGLLGYIAGVIALLMHLMSLRSFGTPYLAPVIPFDKNGNKDVFIRAAWWRMLNRPKFTRAKDAKRQASNLKPKPPKKSK